MTARMLADLAAVALATTAHAVVLRAKPKGDGTFNTSVKIREAGKGGETLARPVRGARATRLR